MMEPASHHGCMMGIERFDLFSCGLQPWYAQKVGGCTLVGISSDYFTAGNYFAVNNRFELFGRDAHQFVQTF